MNHPHILNIFGGGKLLFSNTYSHAMECLDVLNKKIQREGYFDFEWAQCLMCDPNSDPIEQWRIDIR